MIIRFVSADGLSLETEVGNNPAPRLRRALYPPARTAADYDNLTTAPGFRTRDYERRYKNDHGIWIYEEIQ